MNTPMEIVPSRQLLLDLELLNLSSSESFAKGNDGCFYSASSWSMSGNSSPLQSPASAFMGQKGSTAKGGQVHPLVAFGFCPFSKVCHGSGGKPQDLLPRHQKDWGGGGCFQNCLDQFHLLMGKVQETDMETPSFLMVKIPCFPSWNQRKLSQEPTQRSMINPAVQQTCKLQCRFRHQSSWTSGKVPLPLALCHSQMQPGGGYLNILFSQKCAKKMGTSLHRRDMEISGRFWWFSFKRYQNLSQTLSQNGTNQPNKINFRMVHSNYRWVFLPEGFRAASSSRWTPGPPWGATLAPER